MNKLIVHYLKTINQQKISFASLLRSRWIALAAVGCVVGISLLVPTGCSEDSGLRSQLNDLELLVEEDPYKALARIDSIPLNAPSTPEGRARLILVAARARYRCYIDETNDSLISQAVDYFYNHPSTSERGVSRLVLALYQQGVIRENDGNYLLALDSFLEAEAAALPLEDHYFLGYIYRHLGLLYENIRAGKESVYYCKKSYEEFIKSECEPNTAYAMRELSNAYGVYCQFDSSRLLADRCLALPYAQTDTGLRAGALRNAGRAALYLGEPDEAVRYFTLIQKLGDEYFAQCDAWYLAKAYFASGKTEQSYNVASQYLGMDTIPENVPYEILYSRGNIEDAFRAIKNELDRDVSKSNDYARQNLTRALAEYREKEIRRETDNSRRNTAGWILVSCVLVAVVVNIIFVMSRKMRRSRKELTSLMTTMEDLNSELRNQLIAKDSIISEKENENIQARQSYYSLLESQIQQIDEMTSIFSVPTSNVENKRLFKRINRLKENFCDPRFISKMEQEINVFHGDILRRLRYEIPDLKEDEARLFLYQVCGFSGRTITFLTGEELTSLYPRRSRLKTHILRSDAPSKQEFLKYFR